MKEFSSFQERFMSKKIALAFAASCLTAVAAVVPVAASAQDLGSLTDLSSLSVSLFDGPQKQPSPSPSATLPVGLVMSAIGGTFLVYLLIQTNRKSTV